MAPTDTKQSITSVTYALEMLQEETRSQHEGLFTAQRELEKCMFHYVALFDNAPVPYFMITPSSLIQEANTAGLQLLDYKKERLVDTYLWFH